MPSLFYLFLTFVITTFLSYTPLADAAVRLDMAEGGIKTVLVSDGKGMIKLVDTPFHSDFYYDTKNGRFYIVLKEEGFTYYLGTYGLRDFPEGRVKQLPANEGKRFANFEGLPWLLSTDTGEVCGTIYSNKMLSETVGVNLSDVASINLSLSYLFALEEPQSSCMAYRIPSTLGKWVGFPVGFEQQGFIASMDYEEGQVEEGVARMVKHTAVHLEEPYKMSAHAAPLTTAAHVRILEKELNSKNKAHFDVLKHRLKGEDSIQLTTVKELLKRQWRAAP